MAHRKVIKSSAAEVLGKNLEQVIEVSGLPLSRWAIENRLEHVLVQRVVKHRHGVTLSSLERLAKACGLMPWQLLVPGMDPKNPPVLNSATSAEKALYEKLAKAIEDARKAGS